MALGDIGDPIRDIGDPKSDIGDPLRDIEDPKEALGVIGDPISKWYWGTLGTP